MSNEIKYIFSGHESFPCKSLWLKKGYDFVVRDGNFNNPDAVVELGVGKNMVASIRYWLKVFGICDDNGITRLGRYLFNEEEGKDCFLEDLASLWLLHFTLIFSGKASLYKIFFVDFQRERRNLFLREQVVDNVHRRLREEGKEASFNQNTVKKDVNVLLQNYCLPRKNMHSFEDFSSLMIDLDLIRYKDESDKDKKEEKKGGYYFNIDGKRPVTPEIFFYGLLLMKGDDNTVPYDVLQTLGLIFCMTDLETIDMLKLLSEKYSDYVTYSDFAGIKQMQFTNTIDPYKVLDDYYGQV